MRQERGITLHDLAQRLRLSIQQIQKYEAGKDRIAWSRLCEIADAIGVSVKEITDPMFGENTEIDPIWGALTRPFVREITNVAATLPLKERKIVLDMMKALQK
jgi:transcriptional regulator with XRE-family HTH domain